MLALLLAVGGMAQEKKAKKEKTYNEKGEIIKKGWNFGPLPVVGYDADLGFQYGVTCDIFNFGYAKKYEFFGFNGYFANPFDPYADIEGGKSGYHFLNRNQFRFVGSMQRPFFGVPNLYWTAGLAYYNTKVDRINLEGYEDQVTLYEEYTANNIIKEDEAHGGNTTQIRLGMMYDSRDHNSDPTKGIYAEATLVGAPDFIDRRGYSNLSYTFLWRHYIPVYKDKLTFAYRLGAQNRIAGKTPWYMINNLNTMFFQKMYTEGLGGSVTMRGVNRNGVIGEGFAFANLEMRWRIVGFQFINQNWLVALNPFFDAGMVTQPFREEEMKAAGGSGIPNYQPAFECYAGKEGLHMSAGCGLKLIMNRNLIVSAEMGRALDNRDGQKLKTFIGFNYIF